MEEILKDRQLWTLLLPLPVPVSGLCTGYQSRLCRLVDAEYDPIEMFRPSDARTNQRVFLNLIFTSLIPKSPGMHER